MWLLRYIIYNASCGCCIISILLVPMLISKCLYYLNSNLYCRVRNGISGNIFEFIGSKKGIATLNFFMFLHSAVVNTTTLLNCRMSPVAGLIGILFLGFLFIITSVDFFLLVLCCIVNMFLLLYLYWLCPLLMRPY